MACSPEILRRVPLFALLDDEETAVLAGAGRSQDLYAAPAHLEDRRSGRTSLRSGLRRGAGHDRGRGPAGSRGRPAGGGRVLRLRLHARPDPASNRGRRGGRKCLPGSGPPRYRHSSGTQTSCRDGHADRAGPPVSRLAATGAGPRQPQSQRRHRGRHDLRRTHRRPGRQLWRIVDIHHHLCA